MTANYQRSGVSFMYPDNWTIADEQMDALPQSISLQAPGGAFWSVDIHPFSVDPTDVLEQMLAAMREEYAELEAGFVEEDFEEHAALGYNLDFVCLDFVVTSRLRAMRHGHATYVFSYQAEDRDFENLELVFRAITVSLLRDE